jgi:hypothetical protein
VPVVLRPEADTGKVERPVDRVGGIRMRGGEAGVVLEHEDLELDELAEERHGFGRFTERGKDFGRVVVGVGTVEWVGVVWRFDDGCREEDPSPKARRQKRTEEDGRRGRSGSVKAFSTIRKGLERRVRN